MLGTGARYSDGRQEMAGEGCNERGNPKPLGQCPKPPRVTDEGWEQLAPRRASPWEKPGSGGAAAAGLGPGEEPDAAHQALATELSFLQLPPPEPICLEPPAPCTLLSAQTRAGDGQLRDRAPGNATPGTALGAAAPGKEKQRYSGRPRYCFRLQLTTVLGFIHRSWVLSEPGGSTPAPNGTGAARDL